MFQRAVELKEAIDLVLVVNHIAHYLDDFIILGTPHSHSARTVERSSWSAELGVPLALENCEGTSYCLPLMGIEMDTETWILHLPRDKLARILDTWRDKKLCHKKGLESLIGLLQHTCKVIITPG